MDLIKSLMGRRQFLVAAGVTSTSALVYKKLAGVFESGAGTVMTVEKAAAAVAKTTTNKYPHLLSPFSIRNKVLKNRILHTYSPPHSLQGPENYPTDVYRAHYSNMAKNAAVVSIETHWGTYPKTYNLEDTTLAGPGWLHYSDKNWEDIPPVHNYLQRMIEDIHCEGALVASDNIGGSSLPGMPSQAAVSIEDIVTKAKSIEDEGYDIVSIGGFVQTMDALHTAIEHMEAVQKATNLLIMVIIRPLSPGLSKGEPYTPGVTGGDPNFQPYGPELEEVVEMAKMLEGVADIIRMKDAGHATSHPNSFTMEKGKPWMTKFAQAVKESGNKIVVCPTGGYHEPDMNEEVIASGKADMVGMATPLFADPEYVKKLYEDRADDIVPCLRCHDCHGISRTKGPWYDTCNVNPKWGLPAYKTLFPAPTVKKNVAVIGGGPGGMKAAITAAERGHKVTLYEKGDKLGGLLRFTDYTQWKWSYKDFKDYLIYQVKKAGIEVRLNMAVTPETIKTKGYDIVLVALGAEPVVSKVPGADEGNVFDILTVYSNKKALGKNVVLIGAGRIGTETGICLAKDGHKVTILASGKEMIEPQVIGAHNMMNQIVLYREHPNISYFVETTVKGVSGGNVIYRDAEGDEHAVQADSVVIYAGLRPRKDEAIKFSGSAGQVLLLGDCTGDNGTIQKTIRSAFFMASQV